jgi:hypothetical protein
LKIGEFLGVPYIVSDKNTISKYRLKPVTQYDREGNPIHTFESIASAAVRLNINCNLIAAVVRGELFTAGGYLFRKGISPEKIDVSGLGIHRGKKRATRKKEKI